MKYRNCKIALIISLSFYSTSCYYFRKPWETIYAEQEKYFNENRKTFEVSAATLNSSNISDTSLSIIDKNLPLSDTLIVELKRLGISRVEIHKNNCPTKDIRFIPNQDESNGQLWSADKFFILEITFNKCDERNKKGYHWQLEGSEHKHSFGQGDGWFIYSDTDFL